MAKQTVAIHVSEEVLERVEQICERTGENRSVCMERLMRLGADTVEGTIERVDSPVMGRLLELLVESPGLTKLLGAGMSKEELAGMRKRLAKIRSTRGVKGARRKGT